MRFLLIVLSWFAPIAFASQDLNHIACVYSQQGSAWQVWSSSYSAANFNLADGETQLLLSGWTKDHSPNHAYCTSMTGTANNDVVFIETYRYQADSFFGNGSDCSFSGWNVELLAKDRRPVARGSFAEMEIDWSPPEIQRLRLREYFPLKSELATLNKISARKCAELVPRE